MTMPEDRPNYLVSITTVAPSPRSRTTGISLRVGIHAPGVRFYELVLNSTVSDLAEMSTLLDED